ncbi:cysteine/glutathione ABC transporter permease/ATP-binding protein CydD [Frischella sp. Ac48]|uniref:heme ABC transporter permease/ATP-binding protein CydD n=1 Tax=Frischella sp. Ac48 TaxID=2804531 RepID=UPI001C7CBBD7|nr:cysteine/glutathione ABC transporter permease/ATP-binding protein CydD [Frischella sp. Ac48]MBX4132244.1 cysteine/glutathione ABC transporter permease/ATP-binding protein CydD [Frischella sp. Ac48]
MSVLDKTRQTYLLKWLKQQAKQHKVALLCSVLTGLATAICIIMQAALLANILQDLIILGGNFKSITVYFTALLALFGIRSLITYAREKFNFSLGAAIRHSIRQQLITKIEKEGPVAIYHHTGGGLSTLLIEQIEDLHDFYARYLPQMQLSMMIPIIIVAVILPFNWTAALILMATAPLIPIFMILVGMGAADVNRRNFKALTYLSGHFLDRLKGLTTIRLFNQGCNQTEQIANAAERFRIRTMNVLKMAFLSSAVLEFFTSISIAIVAVYFGFSYLGEFDFGAYDSGVTLFAGFFALILAPEFFQPLRDLGTYYHAKAQAIAAADNIEKFIIQPTHVNESTSVKTVNFDQNIETIVGKDLVILSADNQPIIGPLNFTLTPPFRIALTGISGEGKSSILNLLLGFLPYRGSLMINGIEFQTIDIKSWRSQLSWLGQNPYLINGTIRQNLLLADPLATSQDIADVIEQAQLTELIAQLPDGLDTEIGEDAVKISVGQAQRIAIARALLKPCQLMLLDEPTASLDKQTALEIETILAQSYQQCQIIMVTHHLNQAMQFSQIWRLHNQQLYINKPDSMLC